MQLDNLNTNYGLSKVAMETAKLAHTYKALPVVGEHCQSLNIIEFSKATPTKPVPHVSRKYLSSLQKRNCVSVWGGGWGVA